MASNKPFFDILVNFEIFFTNQPVELAIKDLIENKTCNLNLSRASRYSLLFEKNWALVKVEFLKILPVFLKNSFFFQKRMGGF